MVFATLFGYLYFFLICLPLFLMCWAMRMRLSDWQFRPVSLVGASITFGFSVLQFSALQFYDGDFICCFLQVDLFPNQEELFGDFFPNTFSFYFDYMNTGLIVLTNFIFYLAIYYNYHTLEERYCYFTCLLYSLLIILDLLFAVYNLFWFYFLFELSLIPLFFIIGIWGARIRRTHAAVIFLMYASIASFFFLFGLFTAYSWVGTFEWHNMHTTVLLYADGVDIRQFQIFWFCLLITFLAKFPIFPFHIWLPEAHAEAPTVGSVILASILLKVGVYGMIRFLVPFLNMPNFQFLGFQNGLFYFSIIHTCAWLSLLYCTLVAFSQVDFKKIIAYSSIVHMSMCAIGIFSQTSYGLYGAQLMLFSHAFTSAGLFFVAGMIYRRFGTRLIKYYSGLTVVTPQLSSFALFFLFANIGFPGSFNFISELLIFTGIVQQNNFLFALIFGFCFILSLLYTIWIYNKMFLGTFSLDIFYQYYDLKTYERDILISLLMPTMFFGFFPNFFFK